MARRRPDLPTTIYWLVDLRPEMLARSANGWPFYCGKSVDPARRMQKHRCNRKADMLGRRIVLCKGHLGMIVMEVVPAGGTWIARERHWISIIRKMFPDSVNKADGGQGVHGWKHTRAGRDNIRSAYARYMARISVRFDQVFGPPRPAEHRESSWARRQRAKERQAAAVLKKIQAELLDG